MSIAYYAPQNACEKVFSDRYLFRNILSFISGEFHIKIINTKERACPKKSWFDYSFESWHLSQVRKVKYLFNYGPESDMTIGRINFINYQTLNIYESYIYSSDKKKVMKINMCPYYIVIYSSDGSKQSDSNIKTMINNIMLRKIKKEEGGVIRNIKLAVNSCFYSSINKHKRGTKRKINQFLKNNDYFLEEDKINNRFTALDIYKYINENEIIKFKKSKS